MHLGLTTQPSLETSPILAVISKYWVHFSVGRMLFELASYSSEFLIFIYKQFLLLFFEWRTFSRLALLDDADFTFGCFYIPNGYKFLSRFVSVSVMLDHTAARSTRIVWYSVLSHTIYVKL